MEVIIICVVGGVICFIAFIAWLDYESDRCSECKVKGVRCYDSELLEQYIIHKDVKIQENNRNRWIRKAFKIQEIRYYYECPNCGVKHTSDKKKKIEL